MIKNPFHPGHYLQELLDDAGISAYKLAKDTHMPATRVSEILKFRRSITVDTAKRLAVYFGTSEMYWMNLQVSYDLSRHEIEPIEALAS